MTSPEFQVPQPQEWEPLYGFCATNKHSNEDLAKALEAVRRRICAYGGNGRCDCKYGAHSTFTRRGREETGCPELAELIHRLLYRPESFADPSRASAPSEASKEEGFFEEDEPAEGIKAAFDNGIKFVTAPSTSAAPIRVGSASTPPAVDSAADSEADDCEVVDAVWGDWTGEDGRGRRLHVDRDPSYVATPMDPDDVVELASTPPASGSAKRSGCCPCGYNRHNLSGCADCACTVMQKNHHHAPRPASGSSDTGPRKWKEGDDEPLCAYLNPDACYLVADSRGRLWLRRTENTGGGWDRLSTRFGKVGVADWRYLVATYGPLTEMFSSTEEEAPASRKGGDSHEW